MEEQKGLKFLRFDVLKILFERDEGVGNNKYNINVKETSQINDENTNLFRTVFVVDIVGTLKKVTLQINAIGYFELVGEITDQVKQNFLTISAPAIVYPYVRTFISNLTLQSGIGPVLLPPMNFSGIAIQQKQPEPTTLEKAEKEAVPKKSSRKSSKK